MAKWSGGLEPSEEKLLSCAESGELYYPGPPSAGEPMEDWGPDRTIRAEMLRHLLVEPEWPVHAKGLEIRRVRISGLLDLEAATVRCPVWLENCYLDSPRWVALDSATVSMLAFLGCRLTGMSAGTLIVTKGLDLSRLTIAGPVLLSDANITGGMRCYGTKLEGMDGDGYALSGSRMKVSGGVSLTDSQTQFHTQPFTAAGAILLDDADISGGLHCEGAHLDGRDGDGFALLGYRMKVGGGVSLNRAQASSGAIGLIDADITGPLRCANAHISGHDGAQNSLVGDGIKVSSGAYLGGGFHAEGAVSLLDAVITGQLSFRTATISGKTTEDVSLVADRATVSGGLWLDGGFSTAGAVRLSGVSITGMLACSGAKLEGADQLGNSLVGDGMLVSGDAHFDIGFHSAGAVNLRSARIGGALSVMPAKLAGGPDTVALDATAAQIGHELQWEPAEPVSGRVILEDTSAGGLQDSWTGAEDEERPNGCWPSAEQGQLLLNGFTYGRFGGSQRATLEQRLAWIGSFPRRSAARAATDFAPQPYEHLVQVYQQAGQDTEARKVAIARRRDLRWYGDLGRRRKAGNWLLDVTIRYGYETWRALVLLAAVYLLVLAVFWIAQYQPALVVPAQSVTGLHPVPTAMNCTKDYPCFYPAGYAIDTVIPLINIGQGGYWRPNASAPYGWFFEFVSWAGIALGWALATLIVAGYTGLARSVDNP